MLGEIFSGRDKRFFPEEEAFEVVEVELELCCCYLKNFVTPLRVFAFYIK